MDCYQLCVGKVHSSRRARKPSVGHSVVESDGQRRPGSSDGGRDRHGRRVHADRYGDLLRHAVRKHDGKGFVFSALHKDVDAVHDAGA